MGDLNFVNEEGLDPIDPDARDMIPAGWYVARITDAEVKKTRDGSGYLLSVRYSIQGGNYNGRLVFQNINVKNKSQQAEKIGRRELVTLISVTLGGDKLEDSRDLIGQYLDIRLKVQKGTNGYSDKNVVNGVAQRETKAELSSSSTFDSVASTPSEDEDLW